MGMGIRQTWGWQWEGMEIDFVRMAGNGNAKINSQSSLMVRQWSYRKRLCELRG